MCHVGIVVFSALVLPGTSKDQLMFTNEMIFELEFG